MNAERSTCESTGEDLDRIFTSLKSMQHFDSGWGVRLRLATMEGAAEVAAFQYLDKSLSPVRFMPTVGGWSVQYQVIASVVDYVLHSKIRNPLIVELGSGISTSWIGLALKELGRGRLVSVEHDPKFAKITQHSIEKFELSEFVDVTLAELKEIEHSGDVHKWYDLESILERFKTTDEIDLLFVDGPPGNAGPKSRYPAFPLFAKYLAERSVIVLDDTDRKQELDICSEWIKECSSLESYQQLEVIETVGRSTWMRYSRS